MEGLFATPEAGFGDNTMVVVEIQANHGPRSVRWVVEVPPHFRIHFPAVSSLGAMRFMAKPFRKNVPRSLPQASNSHPADLGCLESRVAFRMVPPGVVA
jgi:hypothetical protein